MLAKEKELVEKQKGGFGCKTFFAVQKGIEMQVKQSSQEPNLQLIFEINA